MIEKITHRNPIYKGRILDVESWDVTLPNGKPAMREVVLHKGAAAIVAVDDQGRVALVRQYRTPIGAVLLEIPAGKKDTAEEDALVCAHRELREETGLTAKNMRLLTHMHSTPGFCSEVISLYLATDLCQGQTDPDDDEFLEFVWMDLADAHAMAMRGEITDAKTALGLLMVSHTILHKK